jgi:hypothetical protein
MARSVTQFGKSIIDSGGLKELIEGEVAEGD